MLSRAARARAFYQKRDYVIPDDVLWIAPYVLPHRILPTTKTQHSGVTNEQIIAEIVGKIKVPV